MSSRCLLPSKKKRLLSNIKDVCSIELDGEGVYMNTTFGGLSRLIIKTMQTDHSHDKVNIHTDHAKIKGEIC